MRGVPFPFAERSERQLTPPSSSSQESCIVNVCQPGSNLLCAGYCMYSSSVILVITIGKGVRPHTVPQPS